MIAFCRRVRYRVSVDRGVPIGHRGDVAAGAGDDRFDHAVVFGAGEDQCAGGGGEQGELLDRVHARAVGKPEVHEHDVGADVNDEPDGVSRVGRFADEAKPAAC